MSALSSIARPRATPELSSHVYARSKDYVLYQGDSLALLESFDEHTFDLIFADPPYFLSNGGFTCQSGKRAPVKKGDWDASKGVEDDHAFTSAWLKACQRVLKPSGTIWVSGTQHVIFSVGFAMQQLGYKLLNTVSWYKPNASPNLACRYFTHSTEILIWASPGGKGKLKHTFNYAAMKQENGGKQMRDVWALPRPGDEELAPDERGRIWTMTTPKPGEKTHGKHPTQKPIALLDRIVEACTEDDAVVLDPFCGSGTTGVAAVSKGRRFVGIDMNSEYLALTKKRIESAK
ncbi:MAG: site-specific DNA-methyltransferase [Myxococcota bacterium]